MKIADMLPIEGLELDPSHTGEPEYRQVRLRSPDGLVWIDVDCGAEGELTPNQARCSGHTSYKGKNGVRSFDRRGVEDSFYVRDWDGKLMTVDELRTTLVDQLGKARAALARDAEAMPVPGLPGGFTLTQAELENRRHQLTKTGYVRFMPTGFGTGYIVSKKRSRWANKAKKELVDFLGMGDLYVESLDCD